MCETLACPIFHFISSSGTLLRPVESYKYLGIPQVNGDRDEAVQKSTKTMCLQSVRHKEAAQWQEQSPSHQHICSISHQIPSSCNRQTKGGNRSLKAPHNSCKVQDPETGRRRTLSHYTGCTAEILDNIRKTAQ